MITLLVDALAVRGHTPHENKSNGVGSFSIVGKFTEMALAVVSNLGEDSVSLRWTLMLNCNVLPFLYSLSFICFESFLYDVCCLTPKPFGTIECRKFFFFRFYKPKRADQVLPKNISSKNFSSKKIINVVTLITTNSLGLQTECFFERCPSPYTYYI